MSLIKKLVHKWLFTYRYDIMLMEGARLPVRAYQNDAGYDLYVSRSINIPAGMMVNVSTGIFCKAHGVPAWIFLTGRSSTLIRHGIIIDNGIIDGDYVGELFIKVYNPGKKDIRLVPHMRIGQMIVIPHTIVNFTYVEKFRMRRDERGSKGFGSSGI